jgi:hypothetical protein
MFPNSVESGVHTSTKEELDALSSLALGGMEYEVEFISLSQELTNFFNLNLEL